MKNLKVVLGFAFSIFWSFAYCQEKSFVYRIEASDNINSEGVATTTGFLYKKDGITQGILTTLHGVCGFRSIKAYDSKGYLIGGETLYISKVDVSNDMALLKSSKLDLSFKNEGLELSSLKFSSYDCDAFKGKTATIIGYPMGMFVPDVWRDTKIAEPCAGILKQLIGNNKKIFEGLDERKSPNLETQIFRIQREMPPGQSGSPIIIEGKVVGIVDGALGEGYPNTGWAIPTKNIQLTAKGETYEKLKGLNPNTIGFLVSNFQPKNISRKPTYIILRHDSDLFANKEIKLRINRDDSQIYYLSYKSQIIAIPAEENNIVEVWEEPANPNEPPNWENYIVPARIQYKVSDKLSKGEFTIGPD